MKLAFTVLVTVCAAVAGHIAAAENVTAATNATAVGSAKNGTKNSIQGIHCTPRPPNGLWSWYYNSKGEGPYVCTTNHDTIEWSMLNAYRSGGTENVHWKYTDNVNDGECLKDWKYYEADGTTEIATISGRTTTVRDPRRWCALPVYRSGGVMGKQWDDCWCQWD